MKRLTTPTHVFEIPYQAEELAEIKITYVQNGTLVLEKYKKDCDLEGNKIRCRLTQEETQKFKQDDVKIRIRIKTTGGDVLASKKYTVFCEDLLDEEVL